jgi:hypothetical protein
MSLQGILQESWVEAAAALSPVSGVDGYGYGTLFKSHLSYLYGKERQELKSNLKHPLKP